MKVSLHFSIFDIGAKSMCDTDYLNIAEVKANGDEYTSMNYCGGVS